MVYASPPEERNTGASNLLNSLIRTLVVSDGTSARLITFPIL